MSNWIRFTDTVEFSNVEQSKITDFGNPVTSSNQSLIIKIAATHAGIITRNNGFYLPDRMRKGVTSFTDQYPKPVQVHHDDQSDPIGRVIGAEYVDTSATVKDNLATRDAFKKSGLQAFDNFIKGQMSYIQSVNFICDSLASSEILTDPSYQGLGYTKLTASISSPDAIQKIKDGRYLTGSVGVTTNKAVCSVCKEDWTGDMGPCEHRPGKMYDGVKAFLITGDLTYEEYSMVNVPADRHSRIIEINHNGITDSVQIDESAISIKPKTMVYEIVDNVDITKIASTIIPQEDTKSMKPEVIKLLTTLGEQYKQFLSDADIESASKILLENPDKSLTEDELTISAEAELDKAAVTKALALQDNTKILEAFKTIRPFLDAVALEVILKENPKDPEAFYKAVNDLEWNDYSDSEDESLIKYLAEHPEDAKLSTSARKKLPGSTFCGPNRSFPVPDCAHVTAARRLIGRASVSSATKSRILGCVSRKAKALGCGSTDSVVATTDTAAHCTCSTCKCTNCKCKETVQAMDSLKLELATSVKQVTDLTTELNTLKDQTKVSESTLEETKKELEAARAELKLVLEDLTQVNDQLVTVQEASTQALAERVIDYRLLSGEVIEDRAAALSELVSLGSEKIRDSFTSVATKVDMKVITDSINSGLTRKPHGTVDDPTGNLETAKKNYNKMTVQNIESEYMRIMLGGLSTYGRGRDAAERYKHAMQALGFMPSSGV